MALSCNCPLDASLPDIVIPQCLSGFGQVNKVIFQRLFNDAGIRNSIPISTANLVDAWNVFFAAVDSTRMVITPYVYNPTFTAGAKRTFGGGNATPGGRVEVIGAEATTFTSTINNMAQAEVIKPFKKLMCESSLGVYLINETGKIAGIKNGSALQPIPIDNGTLFVGDFAPGGFENPDTNALEWSFKANWSDDLTILVPDFDPLSDFNNAADPTIASIIFAAGGSDVVGLPTNTAVTIGDSYSIPAAAPTRTNYTFLGYEASGNKTGTFQPGATIANITGTVILTALWQGTAPVTHTITYAAGGTGVTGLPSNGTVNSGDNYQIPSGAPARTNFTFLGYIATGNKTGTFQPGHILTNVTGNVTLTCSWQSTVPVDPEDPAEGYIMNSAGVKVNTFTTESADWISGGVWTPNSTTEGMPWTNQKRVRIPHGVTSIEYDSNAGIGGFGWDGLDETAKTIYPSTITNLGRHACLGIAAGNVAIFQSATPPTLHAQAFSSIDPGCEPIIKVPAASVNAYKAATNWSTHAAYIVAIEEGDVP